MPTSTHARPQTFCLESGLSGYLMAALCNRPHVPRPSTSLSKGQFCVRQASSLAARRKLVLCVSDILPSMVAASTRERTLIGLRHSGSSQSSWGVVWW